MGWELDEVERPFVEQLVGMGWRDRLGLSASFFKGARELIFGTQLLLQAATDGGTPRLTDRDFYWAWSGDW